MHPLSLPKRLTSRVCNPDATTVNIPMLKTERDACKIAAEAERKKLGLSKLSVAEWARMKLFKAAGIK